MQALALHAQYPQRPEAVLRMLDLAIIMGSGAHLRSVLQATAQALHDDALVGAGNTTVQGVLGREPAVPVVLPKGSCVDDGLGHALPRLHRPSLEAFVAQCMAPAQPTVLRGTCTGCMCGSVCAQHAHNNEPTHQCTGCIAHWPAMQHWHDALYWARLAGARTVPVEVGSHYLAEGWGTQLLCIADVLRAMLEDTTVGNNATTPAPLKYLAQHALLEQVPALHKDVEVPDYCCLGELHSTNAWIGPAGTVLVFSLGYKHDGNTHTSWPNTQMTPLHTDPHHNLLCQVVGRKYVRLYAPGSPMYPCDDGLTTNSSRIDLDGGTLDEYPGFAETAFEDTVLEPGDMLYIPPLHWHYVKSLSSSCSVSFWYRVR